MIAGKFLDNIPYVPVMLINGVKTQTSFFVLDTGFGGDLMISPAMAHELGIEEFSSMSVKLAGGGDLRIPFGSVTAVFGDEPKEVQVFIGGGMQLVGIGLLTKFRCSALVDCVKRTVEIENL